MGLEIKKYNVMLYEPEAINPSLKIAENIFEALQNRDDQLYKGKVIPALADKGLLQFDARIDDLSEKAPTMPDAILGKIGIDISDERKNQEKCEGEVILPKAEQFRINFAPYCEFGKIPGSLNDFKQFYKLLGEEDLPVVFMNTIGNGATRDLEALAGSLLLEEFPKIKHSLVIAVDYLRESMPGVLRDILSKHTTSSPRINNGTYFVSLSNKAGVSGGTADEVVKTILNRLSYIREFCDHYKLLRKTTNVLRKQENPAPRRNSSFSLDF